MIINAVVRKMVIDKNNIRLEAFSPKYPQGKALAFVNISFEGKPIKFITDWDDILGGKRPFTINGGHIDDKLIGNSTLISGMQVQCAGDDSIYIVMDPSLIS